MVLLYAIRDYFACGVVQSNRGKNDNNPKWGQRWCYRVRAINDLDSKIIPFFLENPLLTEKSKDFECFKLVINLIKEKQHLTLEGLEKIKEIKSGMNRGRY